MAEKHGMSNSSEYRTWASVVTRCRNPNATYYCNYGGRGIDICEEWASSFSAFFAHIGPKPSPQHQIDRIDNNRGYEPGNVRWATRKENMQHTRRSKMFIINGVERSLSEWAAIYGMPRQIVTKRVSKGMDIVEALTKPKMTLSEAAKLGPPARVAKYGK